MITWEEFKEKYDIKTYVKKNKRTVYFDSDLRKFYNKKLEEYNDTNFELQEVDLQIKKRGYDTYKYFIEKVNEGYYLIDTENKHVKDYIEYNIFNELNLINKTQKKIEKENEAFYYDIKLHKRYKVLYYLGLISWMTAFLWLPFIIGCISAFSQNYADLTAAIVLVSGFEYIIIASFTYPITVPLCFLGGIFFHPKFLKELIFSDKHPYNDELMNYLGHSKSQEKQNASAIIAGTALHKIMK